jgi:hypothetical protein
VSADAAADQVATPADDLVVSRLRIARLEGRIAALEAALERRSEELRELQRHLCRADLERLGRLAEGLPPQLLIPCEPDAWEETRELTVAEVPETLLDLWASLYGTPAPSLAAE